MKFIGKFEIVSFLRVFAVFPYQKLHFISASLICKMEWKSLKVIKWMWIVSCSVPVPISYSLWTPLISQQGEKRRQICAEMLNEMENYRIARARVSVSAKVVEEGEPQFCMFLSYSLSSFSFLSHSSCFVSTSEEKENVRSLMGTFFISLWAIIFVQCCIHVLLKISFITGRKYTSVSGKWIAMWKPYIDDEGWNMA